MALPDAGALMRENQRLAPTPGSPSASQPLDSSSISTPDADAKQRPRGERRIVVKGFDFGGVNLVPLQDLQQLLKPWLRSDVSFAELQAAAVAVTDEYRRRGWHVRTLLPAQDVTDGQIRLEVIEGKFGSVQIDDGGKALRMNRDMLTDTLTARQKPGTALRMDDIERATNLLGDMPGVQVLTTLTPGANPGDTDVLVAAQDKALWAGSGQLDNQGARSTGANRLTAYLSLDNPSGRGDQATANGVVTEGSDYLRLSYSRPVGGDGLRIGVNGSAMQYHLLNEFASLDAHGTAGTVGVSVTYPVVRAGSRNMAAAMMLEARDYRNNANGAQTSRKASSVLTLSLTGDQTDAFGEGGFTLWGLSLSTGRLNLSGNPGNQAADAAGPRTEGSYAKLAWNLARLQRLTNSTNLWFSASGQVAHKNLDSSEKYSLGGPGGVRAYPVLEGSGDAGWLTTLELRHTPLPDWQIIGFYDRGQAHLNYVSGASALNSFSLSGYGLGLQWSRPGGFVLRATVARRHGSNPLGNVTTGSDSDGSKDITRIWLSGSKFF